MLPLQKSIQSLLDVLPDRWGLYYHTLRHLRAEQFAGRLWLRLSRPPLDGSPAPPLRRLTGNWMAPARRRASLIGPRTVRFLNHTRELRDPADWADTTAPRLWQYNLHYFDDLNAEAAATRAAWHRQLIALWLDQVPPASMPAWEPYPLSLRVTNWIKWSLGGGVLSPRARDSLACQLRYLRWRLEYHLLANHLLANAKALVFAGSFFGGAEGQRWLTKGRKLLEREVPEQILDDGGHFERTPLYHQVVFEDLLDLHNLARAYGHLDVADLSDRLPRMARWLRTMCHPDGLIAFFNDAATGLGPTPAELLSYAERLGLATAETREPLVLLKPSGYVRLRGDRALLLGDVGELGPDYFLAHAHADTLSFELSLDGQRLFVNRGTSCYQGRERQPQRASSAHNVLTVDGQDSSEVWAEHRVARRARIVDAAAEERGGALWARATHDGYRRLPSVGLQTRSWTLDADGLSIVDEVEGSGQHRLDWHLHLHPEVQATRTPEGVAFERGGRPVATLTLEPASPVEISETAYHREFGTSLATQKLVASYRTSLPRRIEARFRWAPRG